MTGGDPGIVHDDDIPGLPVVSKLLNHMSYRRRDRSGKIRKAGPILGDGIAMRVEEDDSEIIPFPDEQRESGISEGDRSLIDDRDQSLPQDLQGHGIIFLHSSTSKI
jgi:hypothetical protein